MYKVVEWLILHGKSMCLDNISGRKWLCPMAEGLNYSEYPIAIAHCTTDDGFYQYQSVVISRFMVLSFLPVLRVM